MGLVKTPFELSLTTGLRGTRNGRLHDLATVALA